MIMKKSLSSISWDVSEETYRADPALSYSTLAKFYEGKRLVSLADHDSSKTFTLTYDSNGYLTRSETKRNGETVEYTVYTNDTNGNRLTEKTGRFI